MTTAVWYGLAAVGLFVIGLYGVFLCTHPLRKILGLNTASAGVFLMFVAGAARRPDGAPDAVPHAMVLTGIVVAVSATALALALIRALDESLQRAPGEDEQAHDRDR